MKFTQEISIFNPKAIEFAVVSLGTRIDQTAEQIRIDARKTLSNYSTTIEMESAITVAAEAITSEVSTSLGNLSSRIEQTAKSISFSLSAAGDKKARLSMSYTKEDGSVVNLAAQTITIGGVVTFSDLSGTGTTIINGENITTGSIAVSKLTGTIQNNNWEIDFDSGTFTIGDISANNITTGTLTGRDISGGKIIQVVSGAQQGGIPGNNSDGQQAKIENGIVTCGELAVKGSVTTVSIVPEGGDGRGSYGLYCTGHFSTEGALWTNGTIGEADIICRGNAFAQNFIQSSDRALKTDIEPLGAEAACSVVYGLKPMTFRLKEQTEVKRHGFIAQDVQDLVHDDWGIVTESDVKLIDGRKTLALNYTELIADLVAVIQSQNDRITKLERRTA